MINQGNNRKHYFKWPYGTASSGVTHFALMSAPPGWRFVSYTTQYRYQPRARFYVNGLPMYIERVK